jgi:hypothetical protein
VSAEEMERRSAYLKEQRDRIKASHKAQRDAKLAKYQDEKRRGDADDNNMTPTPGHPHRPYNSEHTDHTTANTLGLLTITALGFRLGRGF